MLYSFLKSILFLLPAERAHHFSTTLFHIFLKVPLVGFLIRKTFEYNHPSLEKELFGLKFKNPVGLAAGFDKDGKHFKAMSSLGFGFIEIGTVTPKGQDGNPKPRLFRLPKDEALINRMGFNNEGVDALVARIRDLKRRSYIIGGNIGKNKITPNDEAYLDYEKCFTKLYSYVDYFVVNVSSPNTPDLRALQDKEPLNRLLSHISELRSQKENYKPVLLKIAPDMNNAQVDDVLEIVNSNRIDGIIACNTTINRTGLKSSESKIESIGNGGLSGAPVHERACEVVKYIRSKAPHLPIIGVGGINSPQDAINMLKSGADLIQVYSGLIYNGPSFIKSIKKEMTNSV